MYDSSAVVVAAVVVENRRRGVSLEMGVRSSLTATLCHFVNSLRTTKRLGILTVTMIDVLIPKQFFGHSCPGLCSRKDGMG